MFIVILDALTVYVGGVFVINVSDISRTPCLFVGNIMMQSRYTDARFFMPHLSVASVSTMLANV